MSITRACASVLVLLGSSLGVQCVRVSSESTAFYGHGQVCVVVGGQAAIGRREGAWLYFNRDGSIAREASEERSPEHPTGCCAMGRRTRDLTDAELKPLLLEGRRLTANFRKL